LVAVDGEPGDRIGLVVGTAGPPYQVIPYFVETRARAPGRQPAADIAAAGHGRQVVKFREQRVAPVGHRFVVRGARMRGKGLDHAERERPAADAASGETQRGGIEPDERTVEFHAALLGANSL